MKKIEVNDTVRIIGKKKNKYGTVCSVGRMIKGSVLKTGEPFTLPAEKLEVIPRTVITVDRLAEFARYEITYAELMQGAEPPDNIKCNGVYLVAPEDMLAALRKIKNEGIIRKKADAEWTSHLAEELIDCLNFGECEFESDNAPLPGLDEERCLLYEIRAELTRDCRDGIDYDLDGYIERLEAIIHNRSVPLLERRYTDREKKSFILHWNCNDCDEVSNASPEVQQLFVRFVEDLIKKDDTSALRAKAYGCYEGVLFEQNWTESRDCLLKLMELSYEPSRYANSLGYIYYYGRCNGGQPQYDEAFRYFSLAAFAGVYEARYKIADMFRSGLGVQKNEYVARRILEVLYDENYDLFLKSNFWCKLADVALRLGLLCDSDDYKRGALVYLMQADFAIRRRMESFDCCGDKEVFDSIQTALSEVKKKYDFKPVKSIAQSTLSYLDSKSLPKKRFGELRIKRLKNNAFSLTVSLHKKGNEPYAPKMFVTIPELEMCEMTEKLVIRAKDVGEYFYPDEKVVLFDGVGLNSFFFDGKTVAYFDTECFEVRSLANAKNEKKHRFVSVRFSPVCGLYDYLCNDESVKVGDTVIIDCHGEPEEAKVVRVYDRAEKESTTLISRFETIVGKAK